jgi:SAM-dependent methyltransferase
MTSKQVESRKLELICRSMSSCGRILDLGAGDGAYLPHLARKAERVVAIEISRELCNLIKADGFEAVLADARFIPFTDDAFDCVWASEIVEHTPSFNMVEEIERVTRQTIVITMPNPWSPHYKRDETHVLKYSLFSFSNYLRGRSKNSRWSYMLRGLGFYWVPLPGFIKKLTAYLTYYLPWFSPTVYVLGVRLPRVDG